MISNIINWCKERNGFVRLPFLLFFGFVLVKQLSDPMYRSVLGALNLGIHELGHMVFSFGGEFLGVAGGTILQLLAPFYGIYNFFKQNDYFSAILCFGWLSTNFFDVATYAADARLMSLPLVSPFGEGCYHDWNYLLSHTNLLTQDGTIALLFRLGGIVSMSVCLFIGGWMVSVMILKSSNPQLK